MKLHWVFLAALVSYSGIAHASPPRISFTRTLPAMRDLGPVERLSVIYAIGDSNKIEAFLDRFVDLVSRAGAVRIENAVENNHHLFFDKRSIAVLRRNHPADVYVGVNRFSCSGVEKSAEGSEHLENGERIKRLHHWIDATCSARIDVLGVDGRKLFSYSVHADGTSPRMAVLTDDERDIAYEQAARFAAVIAADEITPRTLRETIELDENAPSFDVAFAMIGSERLTDARAIWLAAAARHQDSAALFFDLAAVSEAIGDVEGARGYFERAVRLSPKERRYGTEFRLFRRRNAGIRK
jgi:tetratricopeptide (TPR) repeat protein